MRTLLILFATFFLSQAALAQLDDGSYYFINDTYYLTFTVSSGGWEISDVELVNMTTAEYEYGSGQWHKINMNGVDEDYEGPEGFYEFATGRCQYEFDAPYERGQLVKFTRSDCDINGTIYLTYSTEIEAGMMYVERMIEEGHMDGEGYDGEEYDEEVVDMDEFYDEEFFEDYEFDADWANQGYDNIEKLLMSWVTLKGEELQKAILKFQPTMEDCKRVFSDEDYLAAYAATTAAFAEIIAEVSRSTEEGLGFHYVRVQRMVFDQPMVKLYPRKGPFKLRSPLLNYYSFEFLNAPTDAAGRSLSFMVELDGRYLIFPQD